MNGTIWNIFNNNHMCFDIFNVIKCSRGALCSFRPTRLKEGQLQNSTLLSQSTNSPFLVALSNGLQPPGKDLHKPKSVKTRIAFVLFSTQAFHSLSTDLIQQRQIPESFKKNTSSSFTVISTKCWKSSVEPPLILQITNEQCTFLW